MRTDLCNRKCAPKISKINARDNEIFPDHARVEMRELYSNVSVREIM